MSTLFSYFRITLNYKVKNKRLSQNEKYAENDVLINLNKRISILSNNSFYWSIQY